MLQLENS
jgi:hypothetical protein